MSLDVQKSLTALLAGTFSALVVVAAAASFYAPRLTQGGVTPPTAPVAVTSEPVPSTTPLPSGTPSIGNTVPGAFSASVQPAGAAAAPAPSDAADATDGSAQAPEQLKGAYDAHSRVLAVLAVVVPLITTVVGFFFGQRVGQSEGESIQRTRLAQDLQAVLSDRAVNTQPEYENRLAGFVTALR